MQSFNQCVYYMFARVCTPIIICDLVLKRERERGRELFRWIVRADCQWQICHDRWSILMQSQWPRSRGATDVSICNTCMSWRCSISLATDWVRINGLLAGFRSVSSLTWRSHSKNETTIDRDKLNLVPINPVTSSVFYIHVLHQNDQNERVISSSHSSILYGQDRLGGAHHRHLGTESGWPKTTGADGNSKAERTKNTKSSANTRRY